VLPVSIAVLVYFGGSSYDRLLTVKVQSDLAVAHSYFDRVKEALGRGVEALANSAQLERRYPQRGRGEPGALQGLLRDATRDLGLDFLNLYDANGALLASSSTRAPQALLDWKVTREARAGKASTAIDIFSAEQLAQFDAALAARAHTPFIATANATPTERAAESRGMVIHAAAPVRDDAGTVRAVVVGGSLLNKNLDYIDGLNEIVYPEGALPFGSQGTATLFLDDVRVATNVRVEGARAIGTRVSQAVRQTVLGEGRTWLDSAFVVNDWYVSAYEPVRDGDGQRVGMLYVGYPFRFAVKQTTLAIIIGVFLLAMGGATLISLHWARGIFKPIERMHGTMSAAEGGDDAARVGSVPQGDEIGELAAHLDRLLDQLQAQKLALRQWGEELDQRVAERTHELAQALDEPQHPAPVGHLGKTRRCGPARGRGGARNQQSHRRDPGQHRGAGRHPGRAGRPGARRDSPHPRPGAPHPPDRHQAAAVCAPGRVCRLPAAGGRQPAGAGQPGAGGPPDEEGQRGGGRRLPRHAEPHHQPQRVATGAHQPHGQRHPGHARRRHAHLVHPGLGARRRPRVHSGAGMAPEVLAHPSSPQEGRGTGLGLWVSLGLVERYGGRISAESTLGAGATFTVWLRREPDGQETQANDDGGYV
jgi:hypothetical protein